MRVSRPRTLVAASALFGLIHWGCFCNEGLRDAAPKAAVFAADGGMAHEDDDGLYVLEFGRVALGLGREQSFRVRNDGASALELGAASVTGEQGSVFAVVREPSRLTPGGVTEVVVVFAPEMEGLAEARLTLQTNDRDSPRLTFLLTGEGYESALDISPKELHFGKVVLGTEVHLEVRVGNPKSWEREVTLVDWEPASAPARYRIEEGDVRVGSLFAPGIPPRRDRAVTNNRADAPPGFLTGEAATSVVVADADPSSPRPIRMRTRTSPGSLPESGRSVGF